MHAGPYFQFGSLKATLCARGRALTREFCRERNLPYRELGKLDVAVTDDKVPRMDDIEARSRRNRVPGLRRLSASAMRGVEPHVVGVAAVHSPYTAVVDYSAITEAMADDVRRSGGSILLGQEVTAVHHPRQGDHLDHAGTLVFDRLVVCAGLQSDVVARMVGASPSPKFLPLRGEYRALAPGR